MLLPRLGTMRAAGVESPRFMVPRRLQPDGGGTRHPIRETIMKLLLLLLSFSLAAQPAAAATVDALSTCTAKVFSEIGRTHKWSGKPPAGCPEGLAVTKHEDGALVTFWTVTRSGDGWVQTSFSAAESYQELAHPTDLSAANKDVLARGRRLSRCLQTQGTTHVPDECRMRGSKETLASEESGVKDVSQITLNDTGRYCAVEYVVGDTIATPSEPADIDTGDALPPGIQIKILLGGSPATSGTSTGTGTTK